MGGLLFHGTGHSFMCDLNPVQCGVLQQKTDRQSEGQMRTQLFYLLSTEVNPIKHVTQE